jgi:hypothetical protein
MVRREHYLSKAARLLSKNQTVRRIVGRVRVFHDGIPLDGKHPATTTEIAAFGRAGALTLAIVQRVLAVVRF